MRSLTPMKNAPYVCRCWRMARMSGDYPACISSTRRVWTSGWPPAGNAPSAEWTLRLSWPPTVDSSCWLLQLWILVLLIFHCPPSRGRGSAKHPSSPLHHSTSLPSETAVTEGSTKHTHLQRNEGRGGVDAQIGAWTEVRFNGLGWMLKVGVDVYGQMCWGFTQFCQIVYISPYSRQEKGYSDDQPPQLSVVYQGHFSATITKPFAPSLSPGLWKILEAALCPSPQHICTEHYQMISMRLFGVNSCSWTLVV